MHDHLDREVLAQEDQIKAVPAPLSPDLMATLAGFSGGRYSLLRMIGTGSEKIVYLVHDTALDRECALALLRSESISNDAAERFRTEGRAIARLGSHPHIVTVFDIGEHQDAHFLVSEHLAGGDLEYALREARDVVGDLGP